MGPEDDIDLSEIELRSWDGTLLQRITASRGPIQFHTDPADAAEDVLVAPGGWCAPSASLYDNLIDTLGEDDDPEMQDDDPATIVIQTGLGEYTVAGTYAQIKRIAALNDKQKHEFATTLERLKQERGR